MSWSIRNKRNELKISDYQRAEVEIKKCHEELGKIRDRLYSVSKDYCKDWVINQSVAVLCAVIGSISWNAAVIPYAWKSEIEAINDIVQVLKAGGNAKVEQWTVQSKLDKLTRYKDNIARYIQEAQRMDSELRSGADKYDSLERTIQRKHDELRNLEARNMANFGSFLSGNMRQDIDQLNREINDLQNQLRNVDMLRWKSTPTLSSY